MSSLPTGTVTFLFTDIEGSTKLAQAHPAEWETTRQRHHAILRAAAEAHQGYVFQIIGDAFCVAFPTALDALSAAVAAQRALQVEAWGETPIRVRMGLHTGAADARDGEYHGYLTLAHVQRVMSTAYGGQTLASNATAALLSGQLPDGVTLRDMREHRLKGLPNPEHLWQMVTPDLAQDFPPLQSLNTIPNNLPIQVTSFVGRERELGDLQSLLTTTRLLTLTGSGGTGKTRLSLQVAAVVLDNFKDGVWFVELAPLADAALVPQTVANVLGVREEPGRPLIATLIDWLRTRQLLLILDNCEHLIDACAWLGDAVLHAGHETQILASSREALGIAGESAYRVPSLECPNAAQASHESAEQLTQYAAVQLFIERANQSLATFTVTNANAPAIAQICYRLDGIPLAIELAAARIKALSAEKIAERLDDRFRLLTGGSRTALPRQQTLRSLIDWSHSLLPESERILLRRLSVFAGGWTIEAAEDVGASDGLESIEILDLLTHLVDKSLVVLDKQGDDLRYGLLETIRQYARDKLADSGEATRFRDRHVEFYLALAEEAEPKFYGREQVYWFNRLETEHDNFRAAIKRSSQGGDSVSLLRFVAALYYFWFTRGFYREGLEQVQRALEGRQVLDDAPRAARARARALLGLTTIGWGLEDASDLRRAVDEALAIGVQLSDNAIIADAYADLGHIAFRQGEYAASLSYLEQSVEIYGESQDKTHLSMALMFMGDCAVFAGDSHKADALYAQSVAIFRGLGNKSNLAYPLRRLGSLSVQQGDHAKAARLLKESLSLNLEVRERHGITACLAVFGARRMAQGQAMLAGQLFGAVDASMESMHFKLWAADQAEFELNLAILRAQLAPATFDAAWAEGRALTLEQAIALALRDDL